MSAPGQWTGTPIGSAGTPRAGSQPAGVSGITNNNDRTFQRICDEGLIAIVPGDFPLSNLLEIGDALLASPVLVMAVTLDTSSALDGVSLLRERFGDNMTVGAGTVRTVEQLDQAVAAGAQFTVSPTLDISTIERALASDILHIPGVTTPGEAEIAHRTGCRMVGLFPTDGAGPSYLKAVRASLEEILHVPVGGVTLDNVAEYARAGAAAVGLGSELVTGADQPMDDLITRARRIRKAWNGAMEA